MDIIKNLTSSHHQNVEKMRLTLQFVLRPSIIEIFNYACFDKLETESFIDYMNRKNVDIEANQIRLDRYQKEILKNNKDSENLDISLLYKLMANIILKKKYNLFPCNDDRKRQQLTEVITKIKDWRNEFSHNSYNQLCLTYGDGLRLSECPEILNIILEAAGKVYNNKEKAEKYLKELTEKAHDIELFNFFVTNEKYLSMRLKDELKVFYLTKKEVRPVNFCNLSNISFDIMDIFCKLKVVEQNNDKLLNSPNSSQNKSVDMSYLLKPFENKDYQYVLLVGQPGSGKSTITQKLMLEFAGEEIIFHGIHKFDFLFYFEFREKGFRNVDEFLSVLIAKVMNEFNIPSDKLSKLLCSNDVKVIFILDGFDEYNLSSKQLMHEIFSRFKHAVFIVTTRTEALEKLRQSIHENESVIEYHLQGIDRKERHRFINNYIEKLKKTYNLSSDKTAENFMKLIDNKSTDINELLSTPLYLIYSIVLYALDLFIEDDNVLVPADIFKQIEGCKKSKFLNRAIKNSTKDKTILSQSYNEVMKRVEKIAFECLTDDRLDLKESEHYNIVQFCEEKEVDYNSIKSINFKTTIGLLHEDSKVTFSHKSSCEYQCSKYIYELMKNSIPNELPESLKEKLSNVGFYNSLLMVLNLLKDDDNDNLIGLKILNIIFSADDRIGISGIHKIFYNCRYRNSFMPLIGSYYKNNRFNSAYAIDEEIKTADKLIQAGFFNKDEIELVNETNKCKDALIKVVKNIECLVKIKDYYSHGSNNQELITTTDEVLEAINSSR